MPRRIYFLRHAKSETLINGQRDIERELNSRGHSDAPKMGNLLAERGVKPELIVASPSMRTRQTAEYITEQLKYEADLIDWNEEIYEASARTLLNVIGQIDDKYQTVMLIGHNPGISYIAEYFTKEVLGNVPTCGFVEINFPSADRWAEVSEGTGKVEAFLYPKNTFSAE